MTEDQYQGKYRRKWRGFVWTWWWFGGYISVSLVISAQVGCSVFFRRVQLSSAGKYFTLVRINLPSAPVLFHGIFGFRQSLIGYWLYLLGSQVGVTCTQYFWPPVWKSWLHSVPTWVLFI